MKATIQDAGGGIYQVTLPPPLEGFDDFISAWLVLGPAAVLIDVGPASTAPALLEALDTLGVARLDYILLTHIHLDHAGAAGPVAARFPAARVVCHPKAAAHLADPAKLWDGSRRVLGPLADAYGPVAPVPADRLVSAEGFARAGVEAVLTPGHASHHVSFRCATVLFAGEACGVLYALPGGREYMRPATPPAFFLDTALASIDALIALAPGRMAVGHHGMRPNGAALLRRHREQLAFWERWLSERADRYGAEEAVERCAEGLLAEDPLLGAFGAFSPSAQRRERYFLKNSVSGFLGWVAGRRR